MRSSSPNSPFEAPALAARLAEAGAQIARAEGLEEGLTALAAGAPPDIVIVDCALGARRPTGWPAPPAQRARAKSLVLFSPFERRAFGQTSLGAFDGWLVKPVRARSLFERLAREFPSVGGATSPPRTSSRAPARALLAEDNDINAIIAQKALRRLGFEVTRADDGAEAVNLAAAAARGKAPGFDLVAFGYRVARPEWLRGRARDTRRSGGTCASRASRSLP